MASPMNIKKRKYNAPIIEGLEPRILLSADLPGIDMSASDLDVANETSTDVILRDAHTEFDYQNVQNIGASDDSLQSDQDDYAQPLIESTDQDTAIRHELVIIDSQVEDYAQIVDSIKSNADENVSFEVIILDANLNGIDQLSDIFSSQENLDAVHLISHGSSGSIQLGNSQIDQSALEQHSETISLWRNAFSTEGDLLIYGCDLGSNEQGISFVNMLSELTDADVAASDDLTGHADLGGDWDLEYEVGTIETNIALNAEIQQSWGHLLATPSAVNDTNLLDGEEDSTTEILNASMLSNDSDADGDTISITMINGTVLTGESQSITVTNGTVNVDADGNITFTADRNYNGEVSFQYTISDGSLNDTATVSGTISAVNDSPVLNLSKEYSSLVLDNITEDMNNNIGNLVSEIIDSLKTEEDASVAYDFITDNDGIGALEGIAIYGNVNSEGTTNNGTWQYHLNSDVTRTANDDDWTDINVTADGEVVNLSIVNSLLLGADDSLRFVPNENWNGTGSAIQFEAWDQTSVEVHGQVADTSEIVSTNAYSFYVSSASINVEAVNDAPEITSNASVIVQENNIVVTTVTSADVDDAATANYSITGGADESLFSIDSVTGELTFNTAPDFENPTDDGGDNIYDVQVTVDDDNGGTDAQDIAVTVVDYQADAVATGFVTTWLTTSVNESITIPIGSGDTNFTVYWGDETSTNYIAGEAVSHTYTDSGTYTVAIIGDFPGINFDGGGDGDKLLTIEQWGNIAWQDLDDAFDGANNLVINATDAPDLSAITDLSEMFKGATSINSDLSGWDTSKVTDMSGMFNGATAFNQDISEWDTSSVTNMQSMFNEASAFNGDIGDWNVSSVINMRDMFLSAAVFNQDIGGWDTSNVTTLHGMFAFADDFNQNIGGWDTSSVTSMRSAFWAANAFNQDITAWDTSSVQDMQNMFRSNTIFNQDIGKWDTSSIKTMENMFRFATAFNQDIGAWDTASVTTMGNMFQGASDFDQDIGSWKIDNVTNMGNMLNSSGLSIANYDATLVGWAAQAVKSNVTLGASGLYYSVSDVQRQSLIDTYGWTITDAGSDSVVTIEFNSATYSTNENDGSIEVTFTVSSDVVSTTEKEFIFTITGGTATSGLDYTHISPVTITIAAGDYTDSKIQTQSITLNDDTTPEPDETITLVLEAATGEQNVEFGNQTTAIATIINDDNYLPVSTDNTVIAEEDVPYIFSVSDFTFTDVEGDALSSVTITDLNLNDGSLTYSDTSSNEVIDVTNGMTLTAAEITNLTFTSAANDSTDGSFSYTVNDADNGEIAATMNITVNAVNDAPAMNSAIGSTQVENIAQEGDQVASFIAEDVDSGVLTYSISSGNDAKYFTIDIETGVVILTEAGEIALANDALVDKNFSLGVKANDGDIDSSESIVNILFAATNDAAIVSSDSQVLTETDALLSTSGQLTASDVDNTDNTFTTSTGSGKYGEFSIDSTGEWTFTANSAFNTLNVGDNVADTFNITSIDGTASTVTIQINGSNDAATVSSDSQILTETDALLSTSGQLTASDVDNADNTFTAATIVGSIGNLSLNESGEWKFTANSTFDYLNAGNSINEIFNVSSIDGTMSTVTIQINGTNDAATVSSDSQILIETDSALSTSGQLTASDVDNTNNVFSAITTVGEYGTFNIDASGAWIFTANSTFNTLNIGDNIAETFDITSIDGTVSTVAIQINGSNDAAIVSSDSKVLTETDALLSTSGQLTASDVDNADNTFTTTTMIGEYGTFNINASGAWTFNANSAFNTLNVGDNVAETFNITSVDGTISSVAIQINGANDTATVSSASQVVNETNKPVSTSGQLTASDIDNADNNFSAITTIGRYGTLSIDASGTWLFTANSAFNALNSGDNIIEVFNVTSIDGTASTVTIQINGSNDAAIISSASQVINETDAPVTTSGQLTANDIDNTNNSFVGITIVGAYGTFNINESGEWDFTANSAFNTLNTGEQVAEIFNITSIDGTASTVSIQINGSNDAATISSAIKVLNETDLPLSISGQLTANDIDNTDNEFAASTTIGRYGTLSIDASGEWSFTANSAFNTLNVGDKITETFDVFSVDGTVSTVTIQINGSKEIETGDNVSERLEEAFDLRPFSNDEDSNSIYNGDISARNAIGLNIDLTVDLTVDILGNQEQDSTRALRDNILLSVLSERLIDNNDNEVVQSSLENTQTFLQELTSIWQNNGLETTVPLTNFIADNNSRTPAFLEDLDKMQQDLNASAEQNQIIKDLNVGAVTGVGITSAALFVSWLLRGGSLLASLLTAMPAWRSLDVLPILTADETLRNAQSSDLDSGAADAGAEIDALFEDQSPDHSPDDRFKG